MWLGSATFDKGVELSRYTGQITHRISPDIDEERDMLVQDLAGAGMSSAIYRYGCRSDIEWAEWRR